MVGGKWVMENKTRPGAYINVKTNIIESKISERGTVLIPLFLPWGKNEFITVNAESDFFKLFGYDYASDEMLPLRECLKRAKEVKVWSLNNGTKAEGLAGGLKVTARHSGSRGNAIKVNVASVEGNSGSFIVTTLLDEKVVDRYQVVTGDELKDNDFVCFEINGNLQNGVVINLSGGVDGNVDENVYESFLRAAEKEDFDVIAVDSDNDKIKALVTSFIKKLRDEEGMAVQAVLADYAIANHEGIISVKNGVVLNDGTVIDKNKAVYWVAGATAGANVNESNTYAVYEDSLFPDVRYLNSETETLLKEGHFLFSADKKGAVVEQDINSFTSFDFEKDSILRKNRVLRVVDTLVEDIKEMFNNCFLGKINNDSDGRNLFKARILGYLEELQAISAIKNMDKANDVIINVGQNSDSVVIDLAIMPVDSIEKLYMTVIVS